jgi:TolB-like protein/Flp pilus assembly protein TadD
MTEETIAQLGRLNPARLGVIARTSAMRYKGTRKGVDEIGRELKVDYVLEGSVRRQGDRVRVTGQLARVSDQAHVWTQSYDRDARDMLELQADIARGVAREISRTLAPAAGKGRASAVHPDAYQAYLKGRYFRSKAQVWANREAMGQFEEAIRIEPAFALAHVGLAEAAVFAYPSRETMPKAKAAAAKAVALDPALAEAHAALGLVQTYWDWDWPGAARSFQRAVELNPGNAEIHQHYGQYLAAMARADEAIAEGTRALELDPLSPLISHQLGRNLYFARRFDDAIAQYRKTLELEANDFWALFFMGLAYEQKGSYPEAIESIKRSREVVGDSELADALPAVFASSGYEGALREWARRWEALAQQGRGVQWLSVAALYSRLGDLEKAWECLGKAHEERTRAFVFVKVEPQLDNLRKDARFRDLLRRMKFPEG